MYSGKIIAKSTNAIKVQNGSKLIISGGTVENTYSGPTIYAVRTNAFDENKVTINGGSIINNGKGAAIINYTEYYTGIFSKKWKYSKLVLASNVKIKGAVGESHP